jgi:hypothetical protein
MQINLRLPPMGYGYLRPLPAKAAANQRARFLPLKVCQAIGAIAGLTLAKRDRSNK